MTALGAISGIQPAGPSHTMINSSPNHVSLPLCEGTGEEGARWGDDICHLLPPSLGAFNPKNRALGEPHAYELLAGHWGRQAWSDS